MENTALSAQLLLLLSLTYMACGQSLGDLRLVENDGRNGIFQGRLEYFTTGSGWGTVCDEGFDDQDARVACRQLGFQNYTGFGRAEDLGFEEADSDTTIWLGNVRCGGTERTLQECSSTSGFRAGCSHSQDIALVCHGQGGDSTGDYREVRLIDNSGFAFGSDSGRLEIYISGEWTSLCSDTFGANEAELLCHHLGLLTYSRFGSVNNLGFHQVDSVISLVSLDCQSASELDQCSLPFLSCPSNQAVGVECSNTQRDGSTPEQGTIRLVGVTGHTRGMAGRVEVFVDNQWHTVSVTMTTLSREAAVVCRQLGFSHAVYWGTVTRLEYPPGANWMPVLTSLSCQGTENQVTNCGYSITMATSVSHSEDLGVVCGGVRNSETSGKDPISMDMEGDLRLNTQGASDVRSFTGLLEIYHNGVWGTVCDDGFGPSDADVACQQLGFLSALFFGNALQEFGVSPGSGQIWLDDVSCSSGHTGTLSECSHNPFGSHNCDHSEDVGLVCVGVGSLRLTEGSTSSSGSLVISTSPSLSRGRLEIFATGQWGAICNFRFESASADVACRQLGFSQALSYDTVSVRSTINRSLPMLLNMVQCRNDDDFLLLCPNNDFGNAFCSTYSTITVDCSTVSTAASIAIGVIVPLILIAIGVALLVCLCCYCHRTSINNNPHSCKACCFKCCYACCCDGKAARKRTRRIITNALSTARGNPHSSVLPRDNATQSSSGVVPVTYQTITPQAVTNVVPVPTGVAPTNALPTSANIVPNTCTTIHPGNLINPHSGQQLYELQPQAASAFMAHSQAPILVQTPFSPYQTPGASAPQYSAGGYTYQPSFPTKVNGSHPDHDQPPLPSKKELGAPPSYDDVVGYQATPNAPPIDAESAPSASPLETQS